MAAFIWHRASGTVVSEPGDSFSLKPSCSRETEGLVRKYVLLRVMKVERTRQVFARCDGWMFIDDIVFGNDAFRSRIVFDLELVMKRLRWTLFFEDLAMDGMRSQIFIDARDADRL